jgi:hypothetical protein
MRGVIRRHPAYLIVAAITLFGPCPWAQAAQTRFVQQGPKLVGSGAIGNGSTQGHGVALSVDGNTAIVGGPADNGNAGAAWVFTRVNGVWQQQQVLFGRDASGAASQGYSVALSGDGNTALVGGPSDNSNAGAAWVFARVNGAWTQQGSKLVGTGGQGNAHQGFSVALSADGNTAVVGGPQDANGTGRAWVYRRTGSGTWTQLIALAAGDAVGNAQQGYSVAVSADGNTVLVGGNNDSSGAGAAWVYTRGFPFWTEQAKLVGTGAYGLGSGQGWSVAISSDGNTVLEGGPADNPYAGVGAAWVFVRGNGAWSQQGGKLIGTGAVGSTIQGNSVALSADGNIALVGGPYDNSLIGAAWVFVRNNGTWTQQGQKLVGTGTAGNNADQGWSVALSGDGRTAMLGGPQDGGGAGAAWVLIQSLASTHDFNGDSFSDIAWRESGGTASAWLMAGAQVSQVGSFGIVPTSWHLVGQRDFNGDGRDDWLWYDTSSGTVAIWLMNGLQTPQAGTLTAVPGNWIVAGTADFNGDLRGDILWYDTASGTVAIWLMNGLQVAQAGTLGAVGGTWSIAGTGPNGEIFWRDGATGTVAIWLVSGFQVVQTANLGVLPGNWTIVGTGDFDGNGSTDILWRDSQSGMLAIWLMNGLQVAQTGVIGAEPGNWSVAATGDFNGDGKSDILWRDANTGTVALWLMNGLQVAAAPGFGPVGLNWTIQGLNAD